MMIAYKLYRPNWTTHNDCQWKLGKTETAATPGNQLCTDQVIHAYRSAKLAVLLNLAHARYSPAILAEVEVTDPVADDGTKIGVKSCTPIRQIEMPEIPILERIRFAILSAQAVARLRKPIPVWDKWAVDYRAADADAAAAARAAHVALYVAHTDAAAAARAAAVYAAYAAVCAARATHAIAYNQAEAAALAAYTAAEAATAASHADEILDLTALAKQF